jgi:hypothetical protein
LPIDVRKALLTSGAAMHNLSTQVEVQNGKFDDIGKSFLVLISVAARGSEGRQMA